MRKSTKAALIIAAASFTLGVLLLVILGITTSGDFNRIQYKDIYTDNVKDVTSLDFNFLYGNVEIKRGSEFSITAVDVYGPGFVSYVDNGIWTIRQTLPEGETISAFDWEIPLTTFNYKGYYDSTITITLPENFEAHNIHICTEAGVLRADSLHADRMAVQLGAGLVVIDEATAAIDSAYQTGAGSMIINSLATHNVAISCGVGNVEISGKMSGKTIVDCAIGRVYLSLDAPIDDYSYTCSNLAGSISLDGLRTFNVLQNRTNSKEAANELVISCLLGDVVVR